MRWFLLFVSVILFLTSNIFGYSLDTGESDDEYDAVKMAARDSSCCFKAKLRGCRSGDKLSTYAQETTMPATVNNKDIRAGYICLPAKCGSSGKLSSDVEIGGDNAQAKPDLLKEGTVVSKGSTDGKECICSKSSAIVSIRCNIKKKVTSGKELELEEYSDQLMNEAQDSDNTDLPYNEDNLAMMQQGDDDGNSYTEEDDQQQQNDDDNNDDNEVELQEGTAIKGGVTAKVQWHNWFRGNLYIYCGNRAAIYWAKSYYSSHYTDRIWHFYCKTVTNVNFNSCYWTGWQNSYGSSLFAQCGVDYIMTGMYGYYNNSHKDRIFKLYCCRAPNYYSRHCYLSGSVNGAGGGMSYGVGGNRVFTGAYSYFDNNRKDRVWKFHNCHYTR